MAKPKKPVANPYLGQASATVNAALAPVVAALEKQRTEANTSSQQRATFLKQLYEGIAQSQQPLAGQIQQDYTGAADRQAVYAKGYSDTMQKLTGQSADQANALLAQNGSPQTVTDNSQAAGDTLYHLGGFSPASVLNQSGTAFTAAARQLPGQTRALGGFQASQALAQGATTEQGILDKIGETEAQRPGLLQSALSDLSKAGADRQQTAFDQWLKQQQLSSDKQQAAFEQWYKQQQLGLDQKKANQPNFFGSAAGGYYAYDPASGKINQVIAGTGPRPLAPRVVGSDKSGRWAYDPNTGKLTPLIDPVAGSSTPKPKFTPVQIARFKATAADSAKDAFWGVKDPKTGAWVVEPQGYQQTMADLLDHGIPLTVAQNALNRYWKRPGYEADVEARKNGKVVWDRATAGGGRPLRPFQDRHPKAGAGAEPAAYGYASAVAGAPKIIGRPYQGTHAKAFNVSGGSDNWESENAYDIAVPVGTPIYARVDGTIGSSFGSLGEGGRFAGLRLHLVGAGNEWYYGHLSRFAAGIKPGVRVKAGQVIGYSGEANGVAHLHIASKYGDALASGGQKGSQLT